MSESAASNQTFSRSSTSEYLLDQVLRNSLINSFMALDPHPCPDIIYWAADSKQLVIAQPDRVRSYPPSDHWVLELTCIARQGDLTASVQT